MSVRRADRAGRVVAAVAGSLAYLIPQMALIMTTPHQVGGISDPGWFLNSGRNALAIGVVVALAALITALPRSGALMTKALAVLLGATVAMAATLFTIGPGTLFPIVLVIGTCVLGTVVAMGAAIGALFRVALLTLRGIRGTSSRS